MDYDAIVVGLGGMGAAGADALAGRGLRVLALDPFGLGHTRGASHGRTRIVRQAYFESPDYIPLLRRAYALWETFPEDCRLRRVGCLTLGADSSPVVTGATRSATVWEIPIELLTSSEVTVRFPAFAPGPDDVGVFEPNAGFVRPEETVGFLADRARARGADLVIEPMTGWEVTGRGVRVWTPTGAVVADRLVLATGAWTPALAASLALPIRVERRVQHFFAPIEAPGRFRPEVMPTFIWDVAPGDSIYGFPADGADGVKIGFHHRGPAVDPGVEQAPASATEVSQMRAAVAERLPGVAGGPVRSVPCLYDLTPDHNFLLGLAPGLESRVVVAAGFSGHGFKFVPVVGEVVADLVTKGQSAFDLDFLSPARFADAHGA
jgi:sarcosine oxidase